MTGAWILFIFVASIPVSFLLILRYTPAGILLDRHIPDTARWRILLAAISFFLTFATVRALTWSIHNATMTFIWAVATSIIWWGIVLLLVVGYAWMMTRPIPPEGSSVLGSLC